MSEPKRRFINIGTIGHVDHGKTTFTAAITRALHEKFPDLNKVVNFDKIDKAPEERKRGITINSTTITYSTDKTIFSHTDCPGHADYVKNMITGAAQLDAAILLVNIDGAELQTDEHILLAARLGIKHFAVFINKADKYDKNDPDEQAERQDMVDLITEEIKEKFQSHGVNPDNIIFCSGSALKALEGDPEELNVISSFIIDFDNRIPDIKRDIDKVFKFAISETFSITGRGTVAAGVVESGKLNINDSVQIVRPSDKNNTNTVSTTVTGIEAFNKAYESCQAGDNVGLLLRGVNANDVSRGDLITLENATKKYNGCRVEMYILTKDEGGRHSPFFPGYRPQFFIRTADYTGSVHELMVGDQKAEMITPGQNCSMIVEFEKFIPIEPNIQVVIREGGKTIGEGKIVQVLDEATMAKLDKTKKAANKN